MNDGSEADGAPTRAQLETCVTAIGCLFSTWLRLRQLSILYETATAGVLGDFRRFSVQEAADAWREVGARLAETVRRLEELEAGIRTQREGITAMLDATTSKQEIQT